MPVAMTRPEPEPEDIRWTLIKISIGLVAVLLLWTIFTPFTIINAGERGVLMQWGKPIAVLDEGWQWRIPVMQSVAKLDIKTLKYEVEATAASRDLQDVNAKVAVNYHLDGTRAVELYRSIGTNEIIEGAVIAPAIQESVKASTALFNAEELITERPRVKMQVEESLNQRLKDRGILMETVSITDFKFSPQFTQAIESKQVAQQNALQAQNVLQQKTIEALQQVATAQGNANATLINAQAQAQAISIQGQALRENSQVIPLRAIEKWNGVLPTFVSGGQIPFLATMNIS